LWCLFGLERSSLTECCR